MTLATWLKAIGETVSVDEHINNPNVKFIVRFISSVDFYGDQRGRSASVFGATREEGLQNFVNLIRGKRLKFYDKVLTVPSDLTP